ncbi:MAG: hypothetical protein QME68_06925 [Elusimicrobiota bacterium]|nr:hypothetical protein [Elusimicrobiota bacterium]
MQKELQKILTTAGAGLKQLSKKITEIADVVKEDAIYGIRIGKLKLKELNLERKKAAKVYSIGRRTYALYKQGLVTDGETRELCEQLSKLEAIAKKYHGTAEKLKKEKRK